jgi:hypothetical protein
MENSMTISVKICERIYSVQMPDDVNFEAFMEEVKALSRIMYATETVESYWK